MQHMGLFKNRPRGKRTRDPAGRCKTQADTAEWVAAEVVATVELVTVAKVTVDLVKVVVAAVVAVVAMVVEKKSCTSRRSFAFRRNSDIQPVNSPCRRRNPGNKHPCQ